MTSNSTDAPIKDERFEVMFREAEAYVSGKYNSIYKVDAAISTDTAAKWIAQFALDILDLKTQRVADDHAQLLSENAEQRKEIERLKAQVASLRSAGHSRVLNDVWPNSGGGTCPLCGNTCSRSEYSDWVEIECNDCTFTCLAEDFKVGEAK